MEANRKELVAALGRIGQAVSARPGIPALTGVRVGPFGPTSLELQSTDLEIAVSVRVGSSGNGIPEAGMLVPFKLFRDAVRSSKAATVTLSQVDGKASVDGCQTMRLLPVEDFPGLTLQAEEYVRVDARVFADACRRVLPAASRDGARPVLTGVAIRAAAAGASELTLTATDSYRLHVATVPTAVPPGPQASVIVPARALAAIAKAIGAKGSGSVGIAFEGGSGEVQFSYGQTFWRSRIIEGTFPNWHQLAPDVPVAGDDTVILGGDAAEMVATLKAAGPYAGDTSPARIDVTSAGATITASSPDLGTFGPVPFASAAGDLDLVAGFNPGYLADAITAGSVSGICRLELRPRGAVRAMTVDRPCIVRSGKAGDPIALVMPVRPRAPIA